MPTVNLAMINSAVLILVGDLSDTIEMTSSKTSFKHKVEFVRNHRTPSLAFSCISKSKTL